MRAKDQSSFLQIAVTYDLLARQPDRPPKGLHALTLPFPLTLVWRGYAPTAEVDDLRPFACGADETGEECAVALAVKSIDGPHSLCRRRPRSHCGHAQGSSRALGGKITASPCNTTKRPFRRPARAFVGAVMRPDVPGDLQIDTSLDQHNGRQCKEIRVKMTDAPLQRCETLARSGAPGHEHPGKATIEGRAEKGVTRASLDSPSPSRRASSAGPSEVVQALHTGPCAKAVAGYHSVGRTTLPCTYDMTYAVVTLLAALALTQLVKINRPL